MLMLNELKRYNSIGDEEGILFFVKMLSNVDTISYKEVLNRCALERKLMVNCNGMIAFMEYLGYIKCDKVTVKMESAFSELRNISGKAVINAITHKSINRLTEDGVFDEGCLFFDEKTEHFRIKKSSFPLTFAAIRNFLISSGAWGDDAGDSIGVDDSYESELLITIREHRKKMTLEELRNRQEAQNERGLKAEEFIKKYEQDRLPSKANRIKRISDIDVTAGYDIISFVDVGSEAYDRFIEVKSYLGKERFFWSENESDVAKEKGDKYVLCLVDYEKIEEPGYKPLFIVDPYKEIFSGTSWLVRPSSYKVERV